MVGAKPAVPVQCNGETTVNFKARDNLILSDDVILIIATYLNIQSLIELVKAFDGLPQYGLLHGKLSRVPIKFDVTKHSAYKADVFVNLKSVVWKTEYLSNLDEASFKFLSLEFPGYMFAKELRLDEINELHSLPDSIVKLTMNLDEHTREFASPNRWPRCLRKLKIEVYSELHLLCKPPNTLKELTFSNGTVFLDAPGLDLSYLNLGSLECFTTSTPIRVSHLEVPAGKYGELNTKDWVMAFVNSCQGLRRVTDGDLEFEVPDAIHEKAVTTEEWKADLGSRMLSADHHFIGHHNEPTPKLKSLKDQELMYDGIVVPPSVTELELSGYELSPEDFFGVTVKNPAGILSLTTCASVDNCDEVSYPSLENWTALKDLKIADAIIPKICIDEPNVECLSLTQCGVEHLQFKMGSFLRKVDLHRNAFEDRLPEFPDTVEWLNIEDCDLPPVVSLNARGLVELFIDGNEIDELYFNTTHLRFVDNLNMKFIGPMGSLGTSYLPPYLLKWLGDKMTDFEFHPRTTQLTLRLDSQRKYDLPRGLVGIELELDSGYDLNSLSELWAQTPLLRFVHNKPIELADKLLNSERAETILKTFDSLRKAKRYGDHYKLAPVYAN